MRMANCCVPARTDCTNYSAKTKGKNISYHRIPKGALPAACIERIQRANWEDVDIVKYAAATSLKIVSNRQISEQF